MFHTYVQRFDEIDEKSLGEKLNKAIYIEQGREKKKRKKIETL